MTIGGFWRLRCRCGSTELRRSARRTAAEKVLGIALLPWRCERCGRRSFKGTWLQSPGAPGAPPERMTRWRLARENMLDLGVRIFDKGTGDADLD